VSDGMGEGERRRGSRVGCLRLSRWAIYCAVLGMLLALLPGSRAFAQQPTLIQPHVHLELVVPQKQLVQGAKLTAGLHFTLEKGWHIYWLNAGDSGEPPTVKWTLPSGVTAAPFQYPAPQRLPLGPLMDYGYENEVTFPVPISVASDAKTGSAVLKADVGWLVCQNECLPGKGTVAVTRPIAPTGTVSAVDPTQQAIVASGLASMPKPLPAGALEHFHVEGNKGYTLAVVTGETASSGYFFSSDQTVVSNPAPQSAAPIRNGVRLQMVRDENQQGSLTALEGDLVLSNGEAYAVDAIPGAIPAVVQMQGHADSGGFLQAILLAFAGGIVLNLMPCVFPVLFIKGLSLVQSSNKERASMRAHGWVYALGILVSFWVVVAVLLTLRGLGHNLGWGFQFQSPVFLAIMALFLFFLSLSLAGQFEIGLSLTSAGGELAQKQGYAGSFFTGVLAMVVATPCTAPFMGVAIGYALAQGGSGVATFAVFTALALGLAVPYLLLAYNPGWTRLLPRPGAWMEVLKQLTAIPIFATVIWLVWLFTESVGANALLGLLAGFLLLGVAGALLGRWPARRGVTLAAVLVVCAAVALPVYASYALGAPVGASQGNTGPGNDWKPFTPGIVAEAQAQGKPVLVDFTAKWCLSCQVNERVVLDRADVQKRLSQSGVMLVRADWTLHNQDIGAALAALGRSGIPAYALYPAQPGSAPKLLPEVLTPGIVYSALDSLKTPGATSSGE
jgi:thiol:disulfide interchange protein